MARRIKVDSKGWSETMAEWWEKFLLPSHYGQDEIMHGIEDALREARVSRTTPQQNDKRD